jgi:hypothetical protein
MEKLLPRLQLVLVVVFGILSVFGPMLFAQGSLVILASALTGILLGVVTFLIGWRLEVSRTPVIYPFGDWSRGLLKLFLDPSQFRGLKPANRELSPLAREVIGILSLVAGSLLAIALLIVLLLLLST